MVHCYDLRQLLIGLRERRTWELLSKGALLFLCTALIVLLNRHHLYTLTSLTVHKVRVLCVLCFVFVVAASVYSVNSLVSDTL